MLVSEIRKELKKYNHKELEDIILELYKRIPKKKKEEYNIDDYIKDVNIKNKEKQIVNLPFIELKKEIVYFLDCVDNGYYSSPNRIISKKERSGYRFKIKKYYKSLVDISINSKDFVEATELLIEIFKKLSIGSNTLLFVNWETFRALGVAQDEYYDVIIKRVLSLGYTKENLKFCVDLLEIPKDPYELSYDMFKVFIVNLKTLDDKLLAIDIINTKVEGFNTEIKAIKDRYSSKKYDLEETKNCFVKCSLEIYCDIGEATKGIKYFDKYYTGEEKEVKEYILLEILDRLSLQEEWIKEYESKINKIDFRESLRERYNSLKLEK